MTLVRLEKHSWQLAERVGDPSGFGKVFKAITTDGLEGVVKLIPKEPGASRELLFEELSNVPNVVPIIDTGELEHDWAIAMPLAECSLRSHMQRTEAKPSAMSVLPILIDIATALEALAGRVVHRDLKPENVLLLDGKWCLADFGIARYAEASTQPDTRKAALTPHYTAPERWRFERATNASDIYSFGVMAWELFMGRLPFQGPDFRHQHLHEDCPAVEDLPPKLASLIDECLYKASNARPAPGNLTLRLKKALNAPSRAALKLQEANRAIVDQQAKAHSAVAREATEAERRKDLYKAATRSLEALSRQVRVAVLDNAPAAALDPHAPADTWTLRLGSATMGMDPAKPCPRDSFGQFVPPFEVIAFSAIGVTIPPDRHKYNGRSHSLWYGDLQEKGIFRWFETGFMVSPLIPKSLKHIPAAMKPSEDTGKAFSSGLAEWALARPVTPIDQGEEDTFVERWLDWFGQAANGQLFSPRSLPEGSPSGSYRER